MTAGEGEGARCARPRTVGRLRRALREPLLHFLGLGVLLFGVQGWIEAARESMDRRIEISGAEVEGLSEMWFRRFGRPPSGAELRDMVADRVREEVLAREAVRFGLDRADVVVRRRLAQKMEFLLADAAAVEPSEQTLQAFFDERAERYEEPARVGLHQVFFSRQRREDAEAEALAALRKLRSAGTEAAGAWGDPLPLEHRYSELAQPEVVALFGSEFARAVSSLDTGSWQGPIASAYGVHLVFVDERRPARPARLAEVRDRVVRDWQYERREEMDRAAYERLRARYEIVVDLPELTLAAAGSSGE